MQSVEQVVSFEHDAGNTPTGHPPSGGSLGLTENWMAELDLAVFFLVSLSEFKRHLFDLLSSVEFKSEMPKHYWKSF